MNMMIEANISNSEIASCATATATMTHTGAGRDVIGSKLPAIIAERAVGRDAGTPWTSWHLMSFRYPHFRRRRAFPSTEPHMLIPTPLSRPNTREPSLEGDHSLSLKPTTNGLSLRVPIGTSKVWMES